MAIDIDPILEKKIIALIASLKPQATIYLFGSRARGTHRRLSDIDIALDAGGKLPFEEVAEIHDILEALHTYYTIDVVDFNNIPLAMQDAIKREGIVLWKP